MIIIAASDNIDRPVSAAEAQYVIKIVSWSTNLVVSQVNNLFNFQEPHSNGPLFVEMNFYMRVAKADLSRFQEI